MSLRTMRASTRRFSCAATNSFLGSLWTLRGFVTAPQGPPTRGPKGCLGWAPQVCSLRPLRFPYEGRVRRPLTPARCILSVSLSHGETEESLSDKRPQNAGRHRQSMASNIQGRPRTGAPLVLQKPRGPPDRGRGVTNAVGLSA